LTGLLASGLYVVLTERPDKTPSNEKVWLWLGRGWTALLILAVLAGALGQLEGRYGRELPVLLDIGLLIIWIGFLVVAWRNTAQETPVIMVWWVGGIIVAVCHVIGLIQPADPLQERVLRVFAVSVQQNVGMVLMGMAMVFWLMRRFSHVRQAWADSGVYNMGALLAIAGGFVSASPLMMLGQGDVFGILAIILTPLFLLIYSAHAYRALSDPNNTSTLSAHWTALSVVLWFLGLGLIGAVLCVPSIAQVTQGTRLIDAQQLLVALGLVSVILGMMNQSIAEMRGENRRITGLLPFWLILVGTLGSALALLLAGTVQTFLERLMNVGYLDTQNMLAPLYVAWLVGLLMVALGVVVYALGFRARRL
jgi:nitric oxide reductase subunit B